MNRFAVLVRELKQKVRFGTTGNGSESVCRFGEHVGRPLLTVGHGIKRDRREDPDEHRKPGVLK